MTTPSWPIRALRVVVATAIVSLAMWYSPLIAAASWHVFHPGGWVYYRGLHVLVPWPWVSDAEAIKVNATATPEGISLKRMARTMDRRVPMQSLFVTVISPDPGVSAGQQTEGWLRMFRETHPGATFEETTPAAIPAGASCLGASNPNDAHGVGWTCISVKDGWVADFEGQEADAGAFFKVVSNLKR